MTTLGKEDHTIKAERIGQMSIDEWLPDAHGAHNLSVG